MVIYDKIVNTKPSSEQEINIMALIKCSECGKEISDKATACIQCGCPITNRDNDKIIKKAEDDFTKDARLFAYKNNEFYVEEYVCYHNKLRDLENKINKKVKLDEVEIYHKKYYKLMTTFLGEILISTMLNDYDFKKRDGFWEIDKKPFRH